MKITSLLCAAALLASGTAAFFTQESKAQTQTQTSASIANDLEQAWPRKIESRGLTVLIYQPQVEKWQDNRLDSFAAVSVQSDGAREPTYGVVYFTARTEVDKVNRVVTLEDCQATKANFPTDPENVANYLAIIKQSTAAQMKTIALDRLEADLAIQQQAERHASGYELKNVPPRIIISDSPAILVLIDGQPVLRPAGQGDLQRVINTRALMLFERRGISITSMSWIHLSVLQTVVGAVGLGLGLGSVEPRLGLGPLGRGSEHQRLRKVGQIGLGENEIALD